jgi:hypothetical protein
MALSDYQPELRTFLDGKPGSFAVKGLGLVQFTTLIRHHLPDLEALYRLGTEAMSGRKELTQDDMTLLAVTFAEQAPGFVSNLIALASGETGEQAIAAAGRLPFPLQVEIVTAILELTFSEVGGIKKAFERVVALLNGSNKLKQLVTKAM